MIEHKYSFRVMYLNTDQMGTVHHSNYAKYYETAWWGLFRCIGISYSSIEKSGVMLPVIKINFKFYRTTHYDELLTVRTTLKAIKGVRLNYHLFNK